MENCLNILFTWTLVNAYCVFVLWHSGFPLGQSNLTCCFLLRILKNSAGSFYLIFSFMLKNIQNRRSEDVLDVPTKTFPILYVTFQQYLTQNSGRLYSRQTFGSICTCPLYKHSVSFNNTDIHVTLMWVQTEHAGDDEKQKINFH